MKRFSNEDSFSSKKLKEDFIDIIPKNKIKKYYLNEEKTSYIKCLKLDEDDGFTFDEFEDAWQLKPKNKLQIKIGDKLIDCPRYSQNYIRAYNFSGLERDVNPILPNQFLKIYELAKSKNIDLNQCFANWYETDGAIGKHSDNISQLKPESEIFSFSFGPAKRYFYLEPKKESEDNLGIFRIQLEHNVLVIMGGKCQNTHIHHVPKVKSDDELNGRRFNLTFRCFKN